MTNEEIKHAIKCKGMSMARFAVLLGVSYSTLRLSLSDARPMTEARRRHIALLLASLPDVPPELMPAPLK